MVVVLICYLDDSGTTRDSPYITLAGYISSAEAWSKFEEETSLLFRQEKITSFHAKEFFDRKKQFSNWTAGDQVCFAYKWFEFAKSDIMRGITMSLPREKYDLMKQTTGRNASTSIYGHSFQEIVNQLRADWLVGPKIKTSGVSFLVEAGNKNNQEIFNWFNGSREKDENKEILRNLSFIGKTDCFAIQLADYLAFFSRRYSVAFDDPRGRKMDALLDIAKEAVNTLGFMGDEFGLKGEVA